MNAGYVVAGTHPPLAWGISSHILSLKPLSCTGPPQAGTRLPITLTASNILLHTHTLPRTHAVLPHAATHTRIFDTLTHLHRLTHSHHADPHPPQM